MRLMFLLITVLIIGLIVSLQLKQIQNFISPQSASNPANVNQQLRQTQEKVDEYNQTIEDMQNKTNDTLKSLNN